LRIRKPISMNLRRNSRVGRRQLIPWSNNEEVSHPATELILDLADATGDFGASLFALSGVELDASLCNALASLADLQAQIKELYDRQAQQDVLTLGNTVEEYIRTVGSIKTAFSARQKVWSTLQGAEADFHKRESYLDKVKRQAKTQQDRLAQMGAEVADAERRCHQLRLEFEETGKRLKIELERFEKEKVEDFKASVETFLEASVEGQKEVKEQLVWLTVVD
jgi:sorting nexin-1/2